MKVIHLTRTTIAEITGGLEYHIAYLTEGLRKRGHEVEVMLTEPPPPSAGAAKTRAKRGFWNPDLGARVNGSLDVFKMFLSRLGRNLKAGSTVRQMESLHPDIIHQHCYLAAIVLTWLLSRKYPVIFTNHTGAYLYLDRWPITRMLQRRLMSSFAAVIAPSRELLPDIEHSYYIPNGVDTKVFYPMPEERRKQPREKWNFGDKMVFVCPRRWAPTKGIIHLAEAISQLDPATREKSIFVFAGNATSGYGQYQHSIMAALQKVDAAGIRVLGNLDHTGLAELLNAADVCIIPSLMEATSLACLESMASGTPVLATATGGLVELIQDGVNGWLVPPRSSAAIARAIEKIAAMTPAEIRPIKENGLELVRGTYTWERIAAKTEEIYDATLKRWLEEKRAKHKWAGGGVDSGKARQQPGAAKAPTGNGCEPPLEDRIFQSPR